jgi:replicative DNA helicase
VTGDTLVQLADGRRRPVAELVDTEPDVLAMSPGGRLVEARSDKVWAVGTRPVFEVRLASGRSIRCTADHRLYGADGWIRTKDARVGDRLGLARRIPEPAQPMEWPDDRVALLGQLLGDGSYLKGQPMRYATASRENSELVTRAATFEFGAKVKRYRGRGSWHQLLISGNGNRWHPAGVNAWLRELGIFGQRSHEKRIPEEAFRLADRQVALLLRHLWATDGCIHVRRPGQRGGNGVYFATSSHGLADDVAALLLRFGIVARLVRIAKAGYRDWWHVYVSGSTDQRAFLRTVGAFGPRVAPARRLARAVHAVVPNTNVDTLPQQVFDDVRAAMRARGVTHRAMASLRGTSYGGTAHFAFAPSRGVIREYATLLEDRGLQRWAESDLFWDRVVGIEACGEQPVFDLTVPGPASWIADAIVSHNSGALEQDADVVMFIHRDDSDPAKKGLADLIVAKHRNGPTDTIPLTFLPHLTQFRNFAAPSA